MLHTNHKHIAGIREGDNRMKRVLVAYYSNTGNTARMAQYIAEGVRIVGPEAEVKSVAEIESEKDLLDYDGYIFGCPTYHLDIPEPFKKFLDLAGKAGLAGKIGGAFDCRTHPSSSEESASGLIFSRMESGFKMRMTDLGPFDLKPDWLEGDTSESLGSLETVHTCQDYGKAVAEMIE
jgi:flavodoxin